MRALLIILLGVTLLCLTACSDKFEPHHRVVQMEDGQYRVQSAYVGFPGKPRWYKYDVSTQMTRAEACVIRDELIAKQLKKYYADIEWEKRYTVKRVVGCEWKTP